MHKGKLFIAFVPHLMCLFLW